MVLKDRVGGWTAKKEKEKGVGEDLTAAEHGTEEREQSGVRGRVEVMLLEEERMGRG